MKHSNFILNKNFDIEFFIQIIEKLWYQNFEKLVLIQFCEQIQLLILMMNSPLLI